MKQEKCPKCGRYFKTWLQLACIGKFAKCYECERNEREGK